MTIIHIQKLIKFRLWLYRN